MHQYPSDIAFTPSVKAIQTTKGSRSNYERMELGGGWETAVTQELELPAAYSQAIYSKASCTRDRATTG